MATIVPNFADLECRKEDRQRHGTASTYGEAMMIFAFGERGLLHQNRDELEEYENWLNAL